jgi:hypothetical protein
LENRVRNQRRQLAGQEPEQVRPVNRDVLALEPTARSVPAVVLPEQQLAELERLAAELADQRLHLAEECERLVQAQQRWRDDHQGTIEELEAAGVRLEEREQFVELREELLAPREFALAQREEDAVRLRQQLEAGLAQVAARETAWEGERQRLLEQVQAREALTERRWLALVELRRRWLQRRRAELQRLRGDLERCQGFREEYAALWEECFGRKAELDRQERHLAAQSLALEQYRLESLSQAEDPAAAAKQLQRLQRQWAAVGTPAQRSLRRERRALKAEAARFFGQARQLEERLGEAAAQERELTRRLATWEHEQALAEDGNARLRRELQSLQAQRTLYERQLSQTRDELERVARLLIDESEPPILTLPQAA